MASGLYGIEKQLEPTDPITGNAYQHQPDDDSQRFPKTLGEAAKRLSDSKFARSTFGDRFIDDYVQSRLYEQSLANQQITDWQLERYFELT